MKQKRLKFSARTIIIVIAMLFTCIGVSAQENTCIVAGNETSIFGSSWNGQDENNKMVKGNDGKYRKDYTVNKAYKIVQLKVVDGENWIGDANGNNIEFKLTGAGTFTVVFDPNNNNISVTGSIVQTITELEYTTVYVAGNGEGKWLNGVNWTTNAEKNKMTEIETGIWEITFYDVPEGYERQVKFAIDGEWTFNFGGTFEDFGTWSDADYNGSPITFNTDDCDITITLDLRDFDFTTKQGAKFTINIELDSNPDDPEPEPNPAATVTTAPTAAENVFAGTNTALVSAGSVSGGTMMYKMTTTNQKPTNVNGFSTTLPTSENITGTCSVYVWYYVKGDNEHSDSEIFGPVTVSVISSADFSVSGNEYTIHTATGWDVFCNMLANNDKGIFSGKTVCLGASFEVSRMAGSDYHDFTGTFDGQGNTLTFNYGENNTPANADCAAPFRNVENGNIQNLHVMGHIYTSAKYAAGFVGKLYGSVNIKNCWSSIVVHSSTSGDGTHGGFVASNGGTLSIEGCVFDGKLLTTGQTATGNCGGFIGWGSGTITNSLYAPAKLDGGEIEVQAGTGDYPSCTFVRNGSAGDNCYYTRLLGTAQGKAPHTVSAGQDVSIGAIALSGKATTYSVSGITAYANGGIKRTVNETTTFYYGSGDQVSLTLSNSAPTTLHTFSQYTASNDGTLSGSASPYTLTMPDADVTIDATWTMQAVNYLDAADNSARIVAADGIEGLTVALQGRTLYKDGAWNTLCLPFDITNAQLDALDHPLHGSKIIELDVESKEEDGVTPKTRLDNDGTLYLYFNSVYDYMMPSEGLKAGKPYLVKWEKLNGYDENPSDFDISTPVFTDVTIDASASTTVNFNGGAFLGTYSPVSFAANTKSVLFLGAENKLYWPNADMTLKACRAYFDLGTNEARRFVVNFNDDEDNTTGIAPLLSPEGDDAGASPRGGLVGVSWYDLQGRRLSQKPTKAGLYINKGHKAVIK